MGGSVGTTLGGTIRGHVPTLGEPYQSDSTSLGGGFALSLDASVGE